MTRPTLDEIRLIDGTLPPLAWPGGYPIIYLDGDNSTLCAICASEDEVHGSPAVTWFIHYEGAPIICNSCYVGIESAYGDPDDDDWKGYHGPSADDGTEIILGKLDTAPLSALTDHKTESTPPHMSVDRNFRVTIHEGKAE